MTAPTIAQALASVMGDVQAVRKGDRNTQQNFSFRGIDSVLNAVGPALRAHGVVAVPVAVASQFESYASRNGAQMRNTVLTITWRFYGPAGDHIEAQTMGEASDAGDKSVPKAHSVAYRTLLLQALCIPTDEPDPDLFVHERAAPQVQHEPSGRDWEAEAAQVTSAAQVRALWREAVGWNEMTDALAEVLRARVDTLDNAAPAQVETLPLPEDVHA